MPTAFLNSTKVAWTIVGVLLTGLASVTYATVSQRINGCEVTMEQNRVYIIQSLQRIERHTTILEQLMKERVK